jgi:integrative and conjugative element protein (TIGR02256 family)
MNPPEVVVLKDALTTIEQEIEPYRQSDIETGGILIGAYLDDDTVLVVGASGPGPRAEHHGAEYALDHEFGQRVLDEFAAKYPSVDYLGEWHRHPGVFDRPSAGDLETAIGILRDPAYKIDALINPIVILPEGKFVINFYYLHRSDVEARRSFAHIVPRSVGSSDPRVEEFFRREKRILEGDALVQPWYLTSAGRRRLADDKRDLEAQFRVASAQALSDEYVFEVLSEEAPDARVYLICPRRYPSESPRVLVEARGADFATSSRILPRWSPDNSLAQLAAEAFSQIEAPTAQVAPPPPPRPMPDRAAGAKRGSSVAAIPPMAVIAGAAALAIVVLVAAFFILKERLTQVPPTAIAAVPEETATPLAVALATAAPTAARPTVSAAPSPSPEFKPAVTETAQPANAPGATNPVANAKPSACDEAERRVQGSPSGNSSAPTVKVGQLPSTDLLTCLQKLTSETSKSSPNVTAIFIATNRKEPVEILNDKGVRIGSVITAPKQGNLTYAERDLTPSTSANPNTTNTPTASITVQLVNCAGDACKFDLLVRQGQDLLVEID